MTHPYIKIGLAALAVWLLVLLLLEAIGGNL